MEKTKLYFRNEAGEFITAKEWFKKNDSQDRSISLDSNFLSATEKASQLTEAAPEFKTFCTRAILGSRNVAEYGGERETLSITVYKNGDCSLWYTSSITGGDKKDILQRVFDDIDRIINLQQKYAEQANTQFVEII